MDKRNLILSKTSLLQKIGLIIFGIFLSLILLELGLRLGGFIYVSVQEYRNALSRKQPHDYRIMCLGESTTAMGGENSYPSQLEKILNQRNIGIKFCVINGGVSAVTTSYILTHLKQNIDKYKPHMVITMMGTGDGATFIYRDIPSEKNSLIFESLKIYRLAKLLWLHIMTRAKEMGLYQSPENKSSSASSPDIFANERRISQIDSIVNGQISQRTIGPYAQGEFKNMRMMPWAEASGEDGTMGMFCENINAPKAELIKRRNYREVKKILDRRGIRLVCAQYPMLKIEELKQIFEGQKGVVFVDNEGIFKESVKKSGYQKYFTDMFGGDFGHCTPEGNRILAENIANVILGECFKK